MAETKGAHRQRHLEHELKASEESREDEKVRNARGMAGHRACEPEAGEMIALRVADGLREIWKKTINQLGLWLINYSSSTSTFQVVY